jgi:hypothetical protein
MSKQDIIILKFLFGILVNNLSRLCFKVLLSLAFDLGMIAKDIAIKLVKLLIKLFKGLSINKAKFADNDRIQDAQIPQTLQDPFRIKQFRLLLTIRFDTPNKMTITRIQILD